MTTLLYNLDVIDEVAIAIITIHRPDKLNALNDVVLTELSQAVQLAVADEKVRGILITGSGNKSFVAGADISAFVGLSAAEAKILAEKGQAVFNQIENAPKPILAAVNGFALGGGCELAMACHVRFASENARFGQPEVNLGLIPGYGGTQRLPRLVGLGRAIEMMVSGLPITAQRAYEMGLVNRICGQDELISNSLKWLHLVATVSPLAVTSALTAAYQQGDLATGLSHEAELFSKCFATEDAKEGIDAFLHKRAPNFKGT